MESSSRPEKSKELMIIRREAVENILTELTRLARENRKVAAASVGELIIAFHIFLLQEYADYKIAEVLSKHLPGLREEIK